ncbi:unnamed protein product, partial [Effrenium voratum]
KVKELLKGNLVDFAHYEEKLAAASPETVPFHFHRQQPEWRCGEGLGSQGQVHCDGSEASYFSLLCAVALTFERFTHDALLREYPKSDFFRMSMARSDYWAELRALPQAKHYEEMLKSTEDELRWLAIFIGDMHQPLHWLLGTHEYGRNISVQSQGQAVSLFDYWETHLPQQFQQHDFTGAARKEKYKLEHFRQFKEHPHQMFAHWGQELAQVACDIYGDLPQEAADSRIELSEAVREKWGKLYESLVLRGGERLAQAMKELLAHRKHADGHRHGRGHVHRNSAKHLFHNLLLAVPTVLGWLWLLRWHFNGGMQAAKEHLKM